MNPGTLVLVIVGALLAFWAGSRWQHNTRTWSDHKGAVTGQKNLRKLRWMTLRAALAAVAATLLYLAATGAIAVRGSGEATPAQVGTPRPSPSCATHPRPPRCVPH